MEPDTDCDDSGEAEDSEPVTAADMSSGKDSDGVDSGHED